MFKLIKIDNARMNVPEPEYYECGEDIKSGQALYLYESLKLANLEENPKEFIAMADGKAGAIIPVCRICKEQVWETRIDGSDRIWDVSIPGSALNVGSDSISGTVINGENPDATVVWKGEADTFDGEVPTGGPIRLRFLCNYGKDASSSKPVT